jgi:hypothetical protein
MSFLKKKKISQNASGNSLAVEIFVLAILTISNLSGSINEQDEQTRRETKLRPCLQ